MSKIENKFKVGQVWRTRNGEEVGILEVSYIADRCYPIECSDGHSRNALGNFIVGDESGFDLVELVTDAAETALASEFSGGEVHQAPAPLAGVNPRRADIIKIVVRGMASHLSPRSTNEFIELYDSAVKNRR
jgi:hypothetical protein